MFLYPKWSILENRIPWSIVGLLNGRKTQTEVRLNIKIKEVKTDEVVSKRGIGSTQTNIQARVFTDKRRNGVWKIRVRWKDLRNG